MGNGLSDYSSAAFQIHFDLVAINHASKASHCMRVEFHLISKRKMSAKLAKKLRLIFILCLKDSNNKNQMIGLLKHFSKSCISAKRSDFFPLWERLSWIIKRKTYFLKLFQLKMTGTSTVLYSICGRNVSSIYMFFMQNFARSKKEKKLHRRSRSFMSK